MLAFNQCLAKVGLATYYTVLKKCPLASGFPVKRVSVLASCCLGNVLPVMTETIPWPQSARGLIPVDVLQQRESWGRGVHPTGAVGHGPLPPGRG